MSGTTIAEHGGTAQCEPCAATDPGRTLARDAGHDDRTYLCYLAWFGPGLLKVGLTAAERGHDRLLDQAAIVSTLLARGPYAAIRHAETRISGAGLAKERVGARAKADAWWKLPAAADRTAAILTARQAITDAVPLPTAAEPLSCTITDHAADYGLDGIPDRYADIKVVADGTVIAGKIQAIIGGRLLLDAEPGAFLLDTRLITGWQIIATRQQAPERLDYDVRDRPRGPHDHQNLLF
ncbi:DUF2797 domain-containing protein [Streptosporangium subroseum]|uniref:DUF2797 domain-containing protein n=1 Tax=Streptosporangium subroseum TaxID=106412 RepID=UPI0034301A8B